MSIRALLATAGIGVVASGITLLYGMSLGHAKGVKSERGVWSQRVLAGELLKKEEFNKKVKAVNDHNTQLIEDLGLEREKNATLNTEFRAERRAYLNQIKDLGKKVSEYVPNTCAADGTYGFSREFIVGVFNPIANGGAAPGRSTARGTGEVGASPAPAAIGISPIVSSDTPQ